MELSETGRLDAPLTRLASQLTSPGARILVVGPTGSGRTTLMALLARDHGLVTVEPPPLSDADAPLHALVQLAQPLGAEALAAAHDGARDIAERAALLARMLVDSKRAAIAIRLPVSWRFANDAQDRDPDRARWGDRARVLLESLCANPALKIVLFAGLPDDLPVSLTFASPIVLERMPLREGAFDDLSPFGPYEPFAKEVAALCVDHGVAPTPIQFRVAVGLRALEAFRGRDVELLAKVSSIQVLEQRLVRALTKDTSVAGAALRLALARRPIPAAWLEALTQVPDAHAPLLTECLAYGGANVRMHERIRAAVLSLSRAPFGQAIDADLEAAHYAYAKEHRTLDGTAALEHSNAPIDWMERVHHLAGSGAWGASEWGTLVLSSAEHYWARGRALSRARDYAGAAAVYARCLDHFGPNDPYAQHYYGWNLDRAGGDAASAEKALREALALEPEHPWWNGRLVTFLIDHARYIAARREWREALDRLDAGSERIARNEYLAHHFHLWVVRAWLDAAEVELARDAFDAIPVTVTSPALRALGERLLDAEEARTLGESVYPASVPKDERWKRPRRLPEASPNGAARRAWYPGRVIESSHDVVMIVFATTGEEPRRVKLKELPSADWKQAARFPPAGFFELGSYEDGTIIILPVDDPAPDWASPLDVEHELRHFRGRGD
ncbi:MAG: hypothetical protein KF729_22960 [Sandaracinaceae bacterium]|nr:hypothetical protein [Sandaracinaceae bacterium]